MQILLVRLSSLGDIFHAYKVPTYIKYHFPHASVTWLCDERFTSMLKAHPHVDHVIGVPVAKMKASRSRYHAFKTTLKQLTTLRKERFDYAFDLQSNMKSGVLIGFAHARCKVGFSFKTAREWPASLFVRKRIKRRFDYHKTDQLIDLVSQGLDKAFIIPSASSFKLSPSEMLELTQFTHKHKSERIKLMVAIGASRENKKLATKLWVEVLDFLASLAPIDFFCVWGLPHEKRELNEIAQMSGAHIHLLDKMSIPLWQAHMAQMNGLIGLDSSALHLAQGIGVPTFAFFGPTRADQLNIEGAKHQFYQGACPYKTEFDDNERCPYQKVCLTGACLKNSGLSEFKDKLRVWAEQSVLPILKQELPVD